MASRMVQSKVGPNAPCPCGSRRKFKRCCHGKAASDTSPGIAAAATTQLVGRFRFEPGSYGDRGNFAAAISCLKQVRPDEWAYHCVLANPEASFEEEQAAVSAATEHLDGAFAEKMRTGSDAALAAYLKQQGYVSVEGYNVIDEPGEGQGMH